MSANEIIKMGNQFNVLLLGIDNGAYGRTEEDGRSDTMLLFNTNPTTKKKSHLLLSTRDTILRDCRTGKDKLKPRLCIWGKLQW